MDETGYGKKQGKDRRTFQACARLCCGRCDERSLARAGHRHNSMHPSGHETVDAARSSRAPQSLGLDLGLDLDLGVNPSRQRAICSIPRDMDPAGIGGGLARARNRAIRKCERHGSRQQLQALENCTHTKTQMHTDG